MTQIAYHVFGICAFIWICFVISEFRHPERAANWFHAFQSHLFQLQMEAWDE